MKVVLDTNVIVSGLFWFGREKKILQLAIEGKIEVYTSNFLLKELTRVLHYPKLNKYLKAKDISPKEVVLAFQKIAKVTKGNLRVEVIKNDHSDNYVLACAVLAKADFVVSGDKHLLGLNSFKRTKILRPREFLETIS